VSKQIQNQCRLRYQRWDLLSSLLPCISFFALQHVIADPTDRLTDLLCVNEY
jgi:hypothetical protein